jgi:DNA topoisomerase I
VIRLKQEADANRLIQDFGVDDIQVLNGRYGPYITDKTKNARMPKDRDPKTLTLEECRALLAAAPARGNRFGRGRRGAAGKGAAKPAAAKAKSAAAASAAANGDGAKVSKPTPAKKPAAKKKKKAAAGSTRRAATPKVEA